MFKGDASLVVDRPVSVTLLVLAAAFLVYKFMAMLAGKKLALAVKEDDAL